MDRIGTTRLKDRQDRWRELLSGLLESLGGDWQLRGQGLGSVLARQPHPWTIAWIGFEKSSFSDDGWFHAGVESLVKPRLSWSRAFGLRLDNLPGWPSGINLFDTDCEQWLHKFATDPAAKRIESGSVERMALVAKKSFAKPYERRSPPHYWTMTPGWRVVLGTDSPEDPLHDAIRFYRERKGADELDFYQTLLDRWTTAGREGALEFLKEDRKRKMRAKHLGPVMIKE